MDELLGEIHAMAQRELAAASPAVRNLIAAEIALILYGEVFLDADGRVVHAAQ